MRGKISGAAEEKQKARSEKRDCSRKSADYIENGDDRPKQRISAKTYMGSVVTMDQGIILQSPLQLHSDYPLSPEQECIDQSFGHAHHSAYNNGGAVESLRRDGSLAHHHSASPFNYTTHQQQQSSAARFVPDRGVPSDTSSYQAASTFTDSGSGSISTSPSSAASSLTYTTYPGTHYTNLPSYPQSVQQPQAFMPPPYAGARVPSITDCTTQGMLPPPLRTPLSTYTNALNRDAYVDSKPYLTGGQLSPISSPGYPSFHDGHRNVVSAAAGLSLSPGVSSAFGAPMASSASHGYGTSQAECRNFPWPNLEVLVEISCEGQPVTPEIQAIVERGFFPAPDSKWTCYRRNYFSVACSFELHHAYNNGHMTLRRNGKVENIQAMGMRLAAAVDGSQGRPIELIQHTPKRDAGPKTRIDIVKVSPTPSTGRAEHTLSPNNVYSVPMQTFHPTGQAPGPFLPLQHTSEGSSQTPTSQTAQPPSLSTYGSNGASHLAPAAGQNIAHTFERVQFKQATANNGKRRASQQFFHLIVELFADVRQDGSDTPVWVKVAQRVSDKIVVRGRSPSHYQTESQHGASGRGGAASGGGNYTSTIGGAYGNMNPGGFRSSNNGYGGSFGGSTAGHRSNHYGFHPSPEHSSSHSESASSVDGGALQNDMHGDAVMSDADRMAIHDHEGYQYFPRTIYENLPHATLPPLAKVESNAKYSTEPRQYAVKAEYADAVAGASYHGNAHGRFQGVESSRGYYPDLNASYT